ncbi:MAG TPA: 3-isopropylmalate dehydratase small subunit [Polyangia bacterium]|nr:3-isopropylmalate dehydratase small subunit [Polyangia bacterium]
MERLDQIRSRVVVLDANDVDTDQIIPARFLKGTSRAGLGKHLFADWRYLPGGAPRLEFALNRPDADGARILVAGINFGCGSSREHAPWALAEHGFRAVVARSFGDIFRSNALKNGLIPVEVDARAHERIAAARAADAALELTVDVAAARLTLPDGEAIAFPIDAFAQRCLVEGLDELGYLLSLAPRVAEFEARHA